MLRVTDRRVVNNILEDFNYVYDKAAIVDAECVDFMSETNLGRKTAELLKTVLSSVGELATIAEPDAKAASSSTQQHHPEHVMRDQTNDDASSESEGEHQANTSLEPKEADSLEAKD